MPAPALINANIMKSTINLMIPPSMLRPVLLLLSLCLLALSTPELYFSVPYRTARHSSSVKHLIDVEINRYPYEVDLTLLSAHDYLLNVEQAALLKTISDRPDYRKNQESVFGIVEFQGQQQADQRLEFKRRIYYRLYYYVRDFFPKVTWMNLKSVRQVNLEDRSAGMSEGAFNFGPENAESPILKDLKRYSKFMGKTVLAFRGGRDGESGQVIFGDFPTAFIENQTASVSKLEHLGQKFWMLSTTALQLHLGTGKAAVSLYQEMVKVKLTISERTLILPEVSLQNIQKSIPKCEVIPLPDSQDRSKYLACKVLTPEELAHFSLNFTLRDSEQPLSVMLKDLVMLNAGNVHWFDVISGSPEQYQLSESILRQYMIGINYGQGKLLYGLLTEEHQIDRFMVLRIFLWLNLLLFLVSLGIVLSEGRAKEKMKAALKQEFEFTEKGHPSKVNSYELANVSEESFAE